jgi:hypothetical protein
MNLMSGISNDAITAGNYSRWSLHPRPTMTPQQQQQQQQPGLIYFKCMRAQTSGGHPYSREMIRADGGLCTQKTFFESDSVCVSNPATSYPPSAYYPGAHLFYNSRDITRS